MHYSESLCEQGKYPIATQENALLIIKDILSRIPKGRWIENYQLSFDKCDGENDKILKYVCINNREFPKYIPDKFLYIIHYNDRDNKWELVSKKDCVYIYGEECLKW